MSFSVITAEVGGCSGARPRPPACCWMGWAGAGPPALLPPRSPWGVPCISPAPMCAACLSLPHLYTPARVYLILGLPAVTPPGPLGSLLGTHLPPLPPPLWSSQLSGSRSSLLYLDTLSTHHPSVYVCICSRVHMCVCSYVHILA